VIKEESFNKVTTGGLLVTLGIIFGDIGTSPLYVLRAIIGSSVITEEVVLGGVSCIVWTLTIQTTIKYVLITLRADNHGEGGIFALYALVRRRAKWLVFPAIIGGSTILADSIITPAFSITAAVEGFTSINKDVEIIPIVIVLLAFLFFLQQFGTNILGRTFGPVMFVWFTMIALLGLINIPGNWAILKAFNPYYAAKLLYHYPNGFWLLGSIFLCTTGAEALYSDLGHCGRKNIQVAWFAVKLALLLSYFGQGAWLLNHLGERIGDKIPFYAIMPEWFLLFGIIISTLAVIVASQALITGSFTLINEAIRLNLWPKVKINYPTVLRGQLYVPSINWFLWLGCNAVVLYFRDSSLMEAAYGLSIVVTMIMTSILLCYYLYIIRTPKILLFSFILVYFSIEIAFLIALSDKFMHGGWITPVIASGLIGVMWIWYSARKIRNKYVEFVKLDGYLDLLKELSHDPLVSKFSTHLVYLTTANRINEIEGKVIYSIFQKQPKRADIYWFIHVNVEDKPYTMEYKVTELVKGVAIRIDFNLGFRIEPKINLMFRCVVEDMVSNREVDITSRYESLNRKKIIGDFKFVVIEKYLSYDHELPFYEKLIINSYLLLKDISLSEEKAFGLDLSSVLVEKVPLIIQPQSSIKLRRIRSTR
jgi:KUP system potassium uptake protein